MSGVKRPKKWESELAVAEAHQKLRDHIAIEAMKSLIAKAQSDSEMPADYLANLSFHIADEMMKARDN